MGDTGLASSGGLGGESGGSALGFSTLAAVRSISTTDPDSTVEAEVVLEEYDDAIEGSEAISGGIEVEILS